MKNNRFVTRSTGFAAVASLVLAGLLSGCASNTPAPVTERAAQPTKAAAPAKDTYTVKSGDTVYSIAREQGMDFRELIALNGIENPNQISVGRVLKIKPKGAPATSSDVATTAPVTTDVVVSKPIGNERAIEQRPLAGGSNTDTFKREPKAGKVPYSDQALAQAQNVVPANPADAATPAVPPALAKADEKPAEHPATESDWQWPTDGKVIQSFGDSGGKGIDISGKAGDPVLAAIGGKVLIAKSHNDDSLRRYGNMVIIQNPNGIITVYAHNSKLLVKEGQTVSKGQKIAEVGNSGTDQVKLHFEVRSQGKPLDPLKYLPPR